MLSKRFIAAFSMLVEVGGIQAAPASGNNRATSLRGCPHNSVRCSGFSGESVEFRQIVSGATLKLLVSSQFRSGLKLAPLRCLPATRFAASVAVTAPLMYPLSPSATRLRRASFGNQNTHDQFGYGPIKRQGRATWQITLCPITWILRKSAASSHL